MLLRCSFRASISSVTRQFSSEVVAEAKPVKPHITTTTTATAGSTKSNKGKDTLCRRLLSLVYPKRSAVVTIHKWKEEGHTVHKYELNRIVRELRKSKRYKHALEICEWMILQRDIKLLPGDYAVHLDLIAKVRGLNSAEKFFEDLPAQMRGQPVCTALLHTYVQNKDSSKAEALVEKMREFDFLKNPLPFNHMLSMYISDEQLEKVPGIIEDLKKHTSPDIITYNLWLTLCNSQNNVETAERVFLELKKAKIDPDWVTYSILTNLYTKNGYANKAAMTLKEMEKRASHKNRVAYSSLLSLYTNIGDKDGICRIWEQMKSRFRKMSDAEYHCMISSLVKLRDVDEAEKLYAEWDSVSGTNDPRVSNILLAAYINNNQMDLAENFYNRIVERGVAPSYTTWELLTWGYLSMKMMDKVLNYLDKAIDSVQKWTVNRKLVGKIFETLEEEGNIEGAEQLLVILRKVGHVNTWLYNSLLRTYAKAGEMPLVIEERMKKDDVCADKETQELIEKTSRMRMSEVSCRFS